MNDNKYNYYKYKYNDYKCNAFSIFNVQSTLP